MRHSARVLLILIILFLTSVSAHSAIKGGIDYSIPIDYTKLNQTVLEEKAEFYYNTAINSKKLNDDMTSALVLYTILTKKDPENMIYALHLGKLYDVIGKDRYAKEYYYQAMGLDQKRPEPYYYLGDYFYDREQYRKALKFYQRAYDCGYSTHYSTLYKLGDIYQKFGDTQNSIKYLQSAYTLSPNEELSTKLIDVENVNKSNKEFYRR